MKKFTAMLMSAVFMLVFIAQGVVLAADDEGLQNAIGLAKSKFTIPEELSKFTSDISKDSKGETTYSLTWRTDTQNWEEMREISVGVTKSGHVIRYSKWDNTVSYSYERGANAKLPTYTKEQIKAKALEYVKHIDESVVAELDMNNINVNTGGITNNYGNVDFRRVVNGIKSLNDNLHVNIDTTTGELTQYNCYWDRTSTFPSPINVLGVDSAKDMYLKNAGVELTYRNKYDKQGKTTGAYLVYAPKKGNPIDAVTGKLIENEGRYYPYAASSKEMSIAQDSSAYSSGGGVSYARNDFRQEEIDEIEKAANFISVEKAEEIARSISDIKLDSGYKLDSYSYGKNWEDESKYSIRLGFYKQADTDTNESSNTENTTSVVTDGAMSEKLAIMAAAGDYTAISSMPVMEYFNVILDAASGQLVSLSGNYSDTFRTENVKPNISVDKARDTVNNFVKKYFADKVDKLVLEEVADSYTPYNYNYTFYRLENGVKVPFDYISIQFDSVNGKITSVNSCWHDNITFEGKDGILTEQQGVDALFNNAGFELSYQDVAGYKGDYTKADIRLVYNFKNDIPNIVSAKTGKVLDYNGDEYTGKKDNVFIPQDLEGHFAYEQIKTLLETDVITLLPGTTEYKPDEPITQEEFINMAVKLNNYSPGWANTEDLYSYLSRSKIINKDEANPSAPVSREDVAKFTIRVLSYETIAKLEGIYVCGYNDEDSINPDMIGYVALAKGLKIMNGDENGNFNPTHNITRAEAVIMLYNYLSR